MYVKLDTLEQFTREQMQALFMDPYVGFPPDSDANSEALEPFGFVVLEFDPYPELPGFEEYAPGPLRKDGARAFQTWTVVAPTAEATKSQFELTVQTMLDSIAQAHGYDCVSTAVSYADEPSVPKFQKDGISFRAWRSLVWAYAYEQLALVLAGERSQPTVEALRGELPALEFPT